MASQPDDAIAEGDPDLEKTQSKEGDDEDGQMDMTMRTDMDQTMRTNDPDKLNIEENENQDEEGE